MSNGKIGPRPQTLGIWHTSDRPYFVGTKIAKPKKMTNNEITIAGNAGP